VADGAQQLRVEEPLQRDQPIDRPLHRLPRRLSR
jgi:hypothetical protein